MAKLIESPDDVLAALTEIRSSVDVPGTMTDLIIFMESCRELANTGRANCIDYRHLFVLLGKYADRELFYSMPTEFNVPAFCKLLIDKNNAYGDQPIRRWGELGVVIRLDSKLMRLDNLKRNPDVNNLGEALIDTITDILGYCVLGLRLIYEKETVDDPLDIARGSR